MPDDPVLTEARDEQIAEVVRERDERIDELEAEVERQDKRVRQLKDALWYIRSKMDSGGDTDSFWQKEHLRRLVIETVSGVFGRDAKTLKKIYTSLKHPTMKPSDALDAAEDGGDE